MQDCAAATRAECQTEAKEKMAKAMGLKSGADIKSGEFEARVADAAVDAAAKAAKACKDARKDNAAATCEDISAKFNAARGTSKPTDAKKQKQQDAKVKQSAAKAVAKGDAEVCISESATKAEAQACLTGLQADRKETIDFIYADIPAEKREKRSKTADREAARSVVGETFIACMEAAGTNATEKTACKTATTQKMGIAGVEDLGDVDDLIKMHRGEEMAKAAVACAEGGLTQPKQCRDDQKAAAKATGMEEKDWAGVKRQGEQESAAKGMAACSLTDANATECEATGKEQYQPASGSMDDADYNAKKAEIKKE